MISQRLKLLLPVFAWYLAVYSGMYYHLSGKPDLAFTGDDSPISYVITGDQSLVIPGRENQVNGSGENQVPCSDLKKNPKILPGTENFHELVFSTVIIHLIKISGSILINPAVSLLIFPFDYFW